MAENEENWWRGCVMYQVYPRSYCDSNGDGVGDLRGITSKLEYIASLGVEAIWISPFFTSPMRDFGYDVSDYRDVDPLFGRLQDFKDLLEKAHNLGLKILIDQVWSHTSDEHEWFKTSRTNRDNPIADWYVWADPQPDGRPPNNWLSYFGGPAWTWDARRSQYYLHHFLSTQPTLNLNNPIVREEIKKVAAFWLDMGVDGFRLDAAHTYLCDKELRNNPPRGHNQPWPTDKPKSNPMSYQQNIMNMSRPENLDWVEEIRAHINQWDNRCLLGEIGGDEGEKETVLYVKTNKRMHMAYSFGLVGSTMTKDAVCKAVTDVEDNIEDGWMCWSTGNHDFKRALTRVNPDYTDQLGLGRYLMALGLSLRGSFCIYQGEELGLPQADLAFEDLVDPYDIMLYPAHVGRDGCRTPMPWTKSAPNAGFSSSEEKPWLPIPAEHAARAVDTQEDSANSLLNAYRQFIAWRKKMPALRTGSLRFLEAPGAIIAYVREAADGEKILCVFNSCDQAQSWEYRGDVLSAVDEINYNIKYTNGRFEIPPYGYGFYRVS